MKHKNLLIVEFILLCLVIPGVIMANKWAMYMFLFLWSVALYSYFVLRVVYQKPIKAMWNAKEVNRANLTPIVIRWVIASIAMIAFTLVYDPQKLFGIFYDYPHLIPVIFVFYPLFSALPQELIFYSFFFVRYKPLFGWGQSMIAASAVVFAYAHLLYINPVAPTLSLLGGLIFASTYLKTQSLALVTIEHGLYGNSLFLIGLGYYFYGGNVT